MKRSITLIICFLSSLLANSQNVPNVNDKILGKWISPHRNVIVEVYRKGNQYRGKIIWFNDSDDPSRPMASRKDIYNPDPALRNRNILGMDILYNLYFNPKTARWENGNVYDARNGRIWNALLYFKTYDTLEVKGYWKFEFISKSLSFSKYTQ